MRSFSLAALALFVTTLLPLEAHAATSRAVLDEARANCIARYGAKKGKNTPEQDARIKACIKKQTRKR